MAFWHRSIPILVSAALLLDVSEAQSVGNVTDVVPTGVRYG